MGLQSRPARVNLFAALLCADPVIMSRAEDELKRRFGPVDIESQVMDFTYSSYYSGEMGEGLKRKFLGFSRLAAPEGLYRIKIASNRIEKKFSRSGRRTVNIDPGYLDLAKVALLSTKDYTHRIHLSRGIFAEVTLFFKDRTYNPWPWTYPDYRTAEYIDLFNRMRELYKNKVSR